MSELMKKVYYNPSDPGFLRGKERLKHGVLQKYGVALKDKDVTDWLAIASQDAYTLHRTAPVKYKHNRVMVYVRWPRELNAQQLQKTHAN